MTDPWDDAAQRILTERAEKEEQERQAALAQQADRDAEAVAVATAQREMQEAIAAAIPALTIFLARRGAAARGLLAAYSDHACVMFGGEDEGGGYDSVFLHSAGLRREYGTRSGYSSTPTSNRPATPKDAVEAFAYHGPGLGNPQKVRDIVQWLTERIDAYTRS